LKGSAFIRKQSFVVGQVLHLAAGGGTNARHLDTNICLGKVTAQPVKTKGERQALGIVERDVTRERG
jgi:hypothetical protein